MPINPKTQTICKTPGQFELPGVPRAWLPIPGWRGLMRFRSAALGMVMLGGGVCFGAFVAYAQNPAQTSSQNPAQTSSQKPTSIPKQLAVSVSGFSKAEEMDLDALVRLRTQPIPPPLVTPKPVVVQNKPPRTGQKKLRTGQKKLRTGQNKPPRTGQKKPLTSQKKRRPNNKPKSPPLISKLQRAQQVEETVLRAWQLVAAGKNAQALHTLENALQVHKHSAFAPFLALQAWPLRQTLATQTQGLAWANWLIATQPNTPYLGALYTRTAQTLLDQGQVMSARHTIEKALTLPNLDADTSPKLHLLHALTLVQQGKRGWNALLAGLSAKLPWHYKQRALWLAAWKERPYRNHNSMLKQLRQQVEQLPGHTLQGMEQRAALSHFIEARFAAWQQPSALKRAIAHQREHATSAASPTARAQSALRSADLWLLAKQPHQARQTLKMAIQLDPRWRKTPTAVRLQALVVAEEGQLPEAILLLQHALDRSRFLNIQQPSPNQNTPQPSRAGLLAIPETGAPQAIFADHPDVLRLHQELVGLLRRDGRCKVALKLLQGAIDNPSQDSPTNPRSQSQPNPQRFVLQDHPNTPLDVAERVAWNKALCLSELGEWQAAASVLTPLVQTSPLGVQATALALNVQWKARRFKAMQALLQKLLTSNTLEYNAAVASWQGLIAIQWHEYQVAYQHLSHASAHNPKGWGQSPAVQQHLGMVLVALNQPEQAQQHFLRALQTVSASSASLPTTSTPAVSPSNTLSPWVPTVLENQQARQLALKALVAIYLKRTEHPKALTLLSQRIQHGDSPSQQHRLLKLRQQTYLSLVKNALPKARTKGQKHLVRQWQAKAKADASLAQHMRGLSKALKPLYARFLAWPSKANSSAAKNALQHWQRIQKKYATTTRMRKKGKPRGNAYSKPVLAALRGAGAIHLAKGLQHLPARVLERPAHPALLELHRQALKYQPLTQQVPRYHLIQRMQHWLQTNPDSSHELAKLWETISPQRFTPSLAASIRYQQGWIWLQWGSALAAQATKKQQTAAQRNKRKRTKRNKKIQRKLQRQAKNLALQSARALVTGFDLLFQHSLVVRNTTLTAPIFAVAQQLANQLIALPPMEYSLQHAARWKETLLPKAPAPEQAAIQDQLAWVYFAWANLARQAKQAKSVCIRARAALESAASTQWEFQLQGIALWEWGLKKRCGWPKKAAKRSKRWQKAQWNALIRRAEQTYHHIPFASIHSQQRRKTAYQIGRLLLRHTNQGQQAQPWLAKASAKGHDNTTLHAGYLQAQWFINTKQPGKAQALLATLVKRKGVRKARWHVPVYYQLAGLYHEKKNWSKALKHYRVVAAKVRKKAYAPFAALIHTAQQRAARISLHLKLGGGN